MYLRDMSVTCLFPKKKDSINTFRYCYTFPSILCHWQLCDKILE